MSDSENSLEQQAGAKAVEERSAADATAAGRLPLEPMDAQLKDIQPGGGVIIRLELLWGRWRRWFLRKFRAGYVARMAESRKGDFNGCPHEVLDPRDLKFYRNQGGYYWEPQDDPFRWRDNLPFARVGLAELLVFSLLTFGTSALLTAVNVRLELQGVLRTLVWIAVALGIMKGLLIVWFFRNPNRVVPQEAGSVVSPADGKIVLIEELAHDEFIGGPAVQIGIFLSIFNVHINRVPIAARIIGLRYQPGKYLNALRPESARENEQLILRIEGTATSHRRMIVRQITGAIARRIVCWLKPGDELVIGEQLGMIKLGSRTELVLPREDGLQILARLGQHVQAGSSVLAKYNDEVESGVVSAHSADKSVID